MSLNPVPSISKIKRKGRLDERAARASKVGSVSDDGIRKVVITSVLDEDPPFLVMGGGGGGAGGVMQDTNYLLNHLDKIC